MDTLSIGVSEMDEAATYSQLLPDRAARDWTGIHSPKVASTGVSKRLMVLQEMVATEATFASTLAHLVDIFGIPLIEYVMEAKFRFLQHPALNADVGRERDPRLQLAVLSSMMISAHTMHSVHLHFLARLERRLNQWQRQRSKIADILSDFVPLFRVYIHYGAGCDLAMAYLSDPVTIRDMEETFHGAITKSPLESIVEQAIDAAMEPFSSLLIAPIQRLTRYSILFQQLLQNTPDYLMDERKELEDVIAELHKITSTLDQQLGNVRAVVRIRNLERSLGPRLLLLPRSFGVPLLAIARYALTRNIVHEGILACTRSYLAGSGKECDLEMQVLVLTDVIVLFVGSDLVNVHRLEHAKVARSTTCSFFEFYCDDHVYTLKGRDLEDTAFWFMLLKHQLENCQTSISEDDLAEEKTIDAGLIEEPVLSSIAISSEKIPDTAASLQQKQCCSICQSKIGKFSSNKKYFCSSCDMLVCSRCLDEADYLKPWINGGKMLIRICLRCSAADQQLLRSRTCNWNNDSMMAQKGTNAAMKLVTSSIEAQRRRSEAEAKASQIQITQLASLTTRTDPIIEAKFSPNPVDASALLQLVEEIQCDDENGSVASHGANDEDDESVSDNQPTLVECRGCRRLRPRHFAHCGYCSSADTQESSTFSRAHAWYIHERHHLHLLDHICSKFVSEMAMNDSGAPLSNRSSFRSHELILMTRLDALRMLHQVALGRIERVIDLFRHHRQPSLASILHIASLIIPLYDDICRIWFVGRRNLRRNGMPSDWFSTLDKCIVHVAQYKYLLLQCDSSSSTVKGSHDPTTSHSRLVRNALQKLSVVASAAFEQEKLHRALVAFRIYNAYRDALPVQPKDKVLDYGELNIRKEEEADERALVVLLSSHMIIARKNGSIEVMTKQQVFQVRLRRLKLGSNKSSLTANAERTDRPRSIAGIPVIVVEITGTKIGRLRIHAFRQTRTVSWFKLINTWSGRQQAAAISISHASKQQGLGQSRTFKDQAKSRPALSLIIPEIDVEECFTYDDVGLSYSPLQRRLAPDDARVFTPENVVNNPYKFNRKTRYCRECHREAPLLFCHDCGEKTILKLTHL